MRIGRLNYRVKLQAIVPTTDAEGFTVESWQDVATVWAHVAPLLGREALQASQLEEKITHRVTMRYRGDLNNRMRLTFQGRIFQVQSILSPDEARQALQVMCEEVVLGEAVS